MTQMQNRNHGGTAMALTLCRLSRLQPAPEVPRARGNEITQESRHRVLETRTRRTNRHLQGSGRFPSTRAGFSATNGRSRRPGVTADPQVPVAGLGWLSGRRSAPGALACTPEKALHVGQSRPKAQECPLVLQGLHLMWQHPSKTIENGPTLTAKPTKN